MNACRVLFAVAEKDGVTTEVAEYLETMFGCRVKFVYSGRNLIDVVKDFKPEVLIIDVFLPKADTFKVCAELKESPATAHTVIIALSMISLNKRIKSIHADKIVCLPLNRETLADVASKALKLIVATARGQACSHAQR